MPRSRLAAHFWRWFCPARLRRDSLLKEAGFELSVPQKTSSVPGRLRFTLAADYFLVTGKSGRGDFRGVLRSWSCHAGPRVRSRLPPPKSRCKPYFLAVAPRTAPSSRPRRGSCAGCRDRAQRAGRPKSAGQRRANAVPLIGSEESASYDGPRPNRLLASLSETKLLSSRSTGQVARQWAEH